VSQVRLLPPPPKVSLAPAQQAHKFGPAPQGVGK
jgi:hypothetical protein